VIRLVTGGVDDGKKRPRTGKTGSSNTGGPPASSGINSAIGESARSNKKVGFRNCFGSITCFQGQSALRQTPVRADGSNVWRRAQRVVLAIVVPLALAGAGAVSLGWQGPAGASVSSTERSPSSESHGTCTLVVEANRHQGRHGPTGQKRAGGEPGTAEPGNLTVAIPPVVLVRPQGRQLVVTTNTGEGPQSSDTFYIVAGGKAAPAGPAVRQEVLSACPRAASVHQAADGRPRPPSWGNAAPDPGSGHVSPKR
jgi:hypothetical protein